MEHIIDSSVQSGHYFIKAFHEMNALRVASENIEYG